MNVGVFLENKNKSGKDLYILLDDGTDFNGIFIYMQLDNGSHYFRLCRFSGCHENRF